MVSEFDLTFAANWIFKKANSQGKQNSRNSKKWPDWTNFFLRWQRPDPTVWDRGPFGLVQSG